MDTDNKLLQAYAEEGSERAFRELVERYINLVHSAALRESNGNTSQAEDITQAVFTELARRARPLARHPTLAGWLYTAVRRMTANTRRAENRRQRREQEAFIMTELLGPDPADMLWQQVRPELDEVMHELNEADRTAVVLRFFERRSLKEVGLALGLTENAARMRVDRSLEKLRTLLAQRGVKSTPYMLAAVLATGAVLSAPSALAARVAINALTAAASGSSVTLGVKKLLTLAKGKAALVGTFMALLSVVLVWHHVRSHRVDGQQTVQPESLVPNALANDPIPQNSPAEIRERANAAAPSQMTFQALDAATGEPIPNTRIYLNYLRQDGRGTAVRQSTDSNGRLRVDGLQTPFRGVNVFVTADGHVPKVTSWGFGRAMPDEYTMKLERGVTISGIVVDETAHSIPGAKIEFHDRRGNDRALTENIQFGPDTVTFTDPDGRWSCNLIPKDLEQVSLAVSHLEYAETTAVILPNTPEASSYTITMKPGFTVAGTVLDATGHPVDRAEVYEVVRNSEVKQVSKTTDGSGNFEFKNRNAGQLMLAAQAQGFAPAVQTIEVTGSLTGLRFQLGPGQLLRGRVIDEEGNPIGGAWAETTRGFDKIKWSATTGADGGFEWDSAPQAPLFYSFQAEGFDRAYKQELRADGSIHEIKLTREQPAKETIQVAGTAVDAETGQPLDAFKVMRSDLEPDWAFPFDFGATGQDGKFGFSFPAKSSHPAYQLQIEKEGYVPACSTTLLKTNGAQTLHFELSKGSGPSGVVLLPSGEPAANATVLLCTPRGGVTIDGPAHFDRGRNTTTYRAQTDAAGSFSLPASSAPEGLIVIHDQGYAEVSLVAQASNSAAALKKAGLTIALQSWGRVEGSLILDSKPAVNERIVAYNEVARYSDAGRRFTFVTFRLETKTDSAGKFSFEKVPPGSCNIFRQTLSGRGGFESHETSIVVDAGSATQVSLGGTGRPIIGKALLPEAIVPIDWHAVDIRLRLKTADQPGPPPKRADFSSKEAYISAAEHFFEAVRAQRRYGTLCNSDGSFRVPDVPSGTYQLEIKLHDYKLNSVSPDTGSPTEIASITREIIVPELADGQTAEAFDLGNVELAPHPATLSDR